MTSGPPMHVHSSPSPVLISARKRNTEYLILFGGAGGCNSGLVHARQVFPHRATSQSWRMPDVKVKRHLQERSEFSPSTMLVSGIKLRSLGFAASVLIR